MLGWLFPPSCPCDPAAKAWIEERLEWLAEEFDDNAFNGRHIVLPTPEFFPDPYNASTKSVRLLVDRVCGYMDVIPDLVDLELVAEAGKIWLVNESGQYIPHAAGTFEETEGRFLIRVDKSGLHDPIGLVGTIAHELAHARLMGEGRIMSESFDNELLTDLTVLHFGLGVFLANTPRNWVSHYTKWPGSRLLKPEYMTPPMFGWALAHLAWFRGEAKPAWAKRLNMSARINLNHGLKYLFKTADSEYIPKRFRQRGQAGR